MREDRLPFNFSSFVDRVRQKHIHVMYLEFTVRQVNLANGRAPHKHRNW